GPEDAGALAAGPGPGVGAGAERAGEGACPRAGRLAEVVGRGGGGTGAGEVKACGAAVQSPPCSTDPAQPRPSDLPLDVRLHRAEVLLEPAVQLGPVRAVVRLAVAVRADRADPARVVRPAVGHPASGPAGPRGPSTVAGPSVLGLGQAWRR